MPFRIDLHAHLAHQTPAAASHINIVSVTVSQLPQPANDALNNIFPFAVAIGNGTSLSLSFSFLCLFIYLFIFARDPIIVARRFVSITIKGEHIYTRVAACNERECAWQTPLTVAPFGYTVDSFARAHSSNASAK